MSWVAILRPLERPADNYNWCSPIWWTPMPPRRYSASVKQELFLGRNPDNDVVLPASAIANKHARIVLKDGRLPRRSATALEPTWGKENPGQPAPVDDQRDRLRFSPPLPRCGTHMSPETDFVLSECRITPVNRTEFSRCHPRPGDCSC
jgi:hypothetical protein